ncbi:MAG: hypothetical protein IMF16_08850 [Proteobacteria bacterium]|nr:hypothetical protein [Pseudomonadota bacterium]
MSTHRSYRKKRGFAFVAALMVMLVMAILISAVLLMAITSRELTASRQEYTQAIYLSEAGVNAVISDWRHSGVANPPPQPYLGDLANGPGVGAYHVTWTTPDPNGVITLTSQGTVNTSLEGSIYHLTRTVQVDLDTDGDWAWNHVYYSDTDLPEMADPPYADVKGGTGEVEIDGEVGAPGDFLDHPNGPQGGAMLPSPMWDIWHAWVREDLSCDPETHQPIPRDIDNDGVADPRWVDQSTLDAFTDTSIDAIPDDPVTGEITPQHVYWYGSSTSTPLDPLAHAADDHAANDENYFMPDWYQEMNPDAYVCNSSNKRFTVTFGKNESTAGVYTGNFFVHGDIQIKQNARIRGTLIATGDITFFGVDNIQITPDAMNPDAPCEERVYYPALIAGADVLVRDQGNTTPGDPDPSRLRVSGIIWAGNSYTGAASDVEGCVVAPNVRLGGNFLVRYAANIAGCDYIPGAQTPPWFREPDRGEMQPLPRSWREL